MTLQLRLFLAIYVLSAAFLSGCAGTSTVTAAADSDETFTNVLVITIAGDYNTRAQFERGVVSNIRNTGNSASAWYSVAGGNKPVVKEDVIAAVEEQGFDAVLAVRRLDGDVEMKVKKSRTEIDETPIGGRFLNLFRSDYTDYRKIFCFAVHAFLVFPTWFSQKYKRKPFEFRACLRFIY